MKRIRVATRQIHFYRQGKYVATLPQGLTASAALAYVECYNRLRRTDGMKAMLTSEESVASPPQVSPGPR